MIVISEPQRFLWSIVRKECNYARHADCLDARPMTMPATPQRVYRLLERPMSASPAPASYHSSPAVTPPRTAPATTDSPNPFSTPYSPRYFQHTPNGSI